MIVGRRYAIYSLFFYVCSVLYITIILVCQTTIFALFAFNSELIKQLVCKLKAKKKSNLSDVVFMLWTYTKVHFGKLARNYINGSRYDIAT